MRILVFALALALAGCGGTIHGVAADAQNDWHKIDPPPKAVFRPRPPPQSQPVIRHQSSPMPAPNGPSQDGKVMDVH